MDVAGLLSLLEGHPFRLERRDVRFWTPNPLEGFLCKSLFLCLVDLSPLGESVFLLLWRNKVPRKVRFFTWQVLHGRTFFFLKSKLASLLIIIKLKLQKFYTKS